MTVVERIVELARKHYAGDLAHLRFTFAVSGAAKMVQFADRIEATTKDKMAAEQILKESTSVAVGHAETTGGRR